MKIFLKISLLLLLSQFSRAQSLQSELDSLRHVLQLAKNDTLQMNICSRLSSKYDDVNLDSSVYYSTKAIEIANKLRLRFDEVTMSVRQCWPLGKMGNYPRAFKQLNNGLDFFSNSSNEKYIYNISAGESAELIRKFWLVYTYNALGGLYDFAGNYEKAMISCRQSIQLASSIKDHWESADAYSVMGEACFKLNKIDSAIYYCQKSITLFETSTQRKYLPNVFIQMGEIFNHKGDINLAKQYFNKAIQAGILYKNSVQKGEAHIWLARIYQSQNKIDSSLYQAKEAVTVFKLSGKEKSAAIAYRTVADCYGIMGMTDSSFAYLKTATLLNDKLTKAEREKIQEFQVAGFEETLKFQQLEEEKIKTQNRIRTYGMLAGIVILSVIGFILYRNNKKEKRAKALIEKTLAELKSTQSQLIQSEKMASLGELTAGIAHEIQNPLNFVNNFSEVNKELIDEMQQELKAGKIDDAIELSNDIKANEEKINHHGKRADAIVKGMLQHSSSGSGKKEPTDINKLADEYLRLAYHGLRAKDKSFNATMKTDYDESIGSINIIPQDIGRVILNLINNAFYVVNEKALSAVATPTAAKYEPTISVSTKKLNGKVEIKVIDNGNGIPQKVLDKIFQPFFTTKPTGQGTGLGLSLSYDIVKAHGGEIKVETIENEGSEFIFQLPVNTAP
jgi:two-component system, NtrC family, sensor kinase